MGLLLGSNDKQKKFIDEKEEQKFRCESLVELNYSFVSNCGPYVFNGQTYTTSGYYSFYYTSAQGCDSVIDIDLETSSG
jgi:hypothetical protein